MRCAGLAVGLGLLVVSQLVVVEVGRANPVPPAAELFAAIERHDARQVKALLELGVNVHARDLDAKTPLIIAAKSASVPIVTALLNAGARVDDVTDNGGTALMFAAIHGEPKVMHLLLGAGSDVNAIGGFRWTALMVAAVKGHANATRLLLERGANPNLPDLYGWTPLMRAIENEKSAVVKILLDVPETDVTAINEEGLSALHLAVGRGANSIVEALLARGADAEQADNEGQRPVDYARFHGHLQLLPLLEPAR